MSLLEQIFAGGVVGAGGAGFPTHKKLTGAADTLIINAAECEPLLASDRYVMRVYAAEIRSALLALKQEFGFKRVVIGLKEHYAREVAALKAAISDGDGIEIFTFDSFYPAGDEQVLIYEITGRAVPPGGIPLAIGVVVQNVTTVLNICEAMRGKPVTEKFVTVNGAVKRPAIVIAPVGASAVDCIDAAGGPTGPGGYVIKGGPMMGMQFPMSEAASLTISKADGGLVVLPEGHPLALFGQKPVAHIVNQAKSVCIQCSSCTEMCPRNLIGHKLRPHLVMRGMAMGTDADDLSEALLCCECGICELFACPMLLSPRRINVHVKGLLREKGVGIADKNLYPEQAAPREYRKIPQSRLIGRLLPNGYPTTIDDVTRLEPAVVRIPLKHGAGRPSAAVVGVGQRVAKGDVVAAVDFADVGCIVHASIAGRVTGVDGCVVIERETEGVAE